MRTSSLAKLGFGVWTLAAAHGSTAFALALPLGTPQTDAALRARGAAGRLEATDVDFTAIVALSDCSGSVVRFTTSQPDDQAMVLTNGHCFEGGFIDAGTAIVNRASRRSFTLLSHDSSRLGTLRAAKVMYATMTGTDMTLYKLSNTYAEIETQYGIQALTLSDHRPEAGDPIRVVSGYWRSIYSCNIDNFVHELRESEWAWQDSIRYTQPGCETIGGTSGSPIINADTHEVIGVNNTGNEDGQRCTLNNPCEVDEAGNITVTRDAAYGQQTYWLYSCLSSTNEIDLTLPGCPLTQASH
jgi:V8-like Glu-specific endopeptidase